MEEPAKKSVNPLSLGLRRREFNAEKVIHGWTARLERQRPAMVGQKTALQERAAFILNEITSYLFNDQIGKVEPSFLSASAVNFELYTLSDVILECSLLRTEILDHLNWPGNHAERSFVISIFDREIAKLGMEACRSTHLRAAQPQQEARLPQDTQLIAAPELNAEISGTLPYKNSLHAPHYKHRLLKERAELLAEASKVFSGSIDYDETVRRVTKFVVRTVADWCILDAEDDRQRMHRRAVIHRNPAKTPLADELWRDFGPHQEARGVPSHVLRNKQSLLIPEVTDKHYQATARSPRHEQILREMGSKSYMCVPLIARGTYLGAVTFVSGEHSKLYDTDDLLFAEELCSRAALAIDNSIQYQKAQNAIQLREDFINIVSHDLKNPLQVINLSADLLNSREWKDRQVTRKVVDRIKQSGQQMFHLISDLLDLSKFEAGQFRLDLKEEPIASILREVVDSFSPVGTSKGLELSFHCPEALVVDCDRARLTQAISNLVANAIKFTPSGGKVLIEAESVHGAIQITVKDTGPGIPSADLPRLFDRFWQASATARRGTGIGLSIVKAMVESHGGTVEVKSIQGYGSTFLIRLPGSNGKTTSVLSL